MDELLDFVDLIADTGLEGIITWILRIIGVILLLAGIGFWLFTDMGLLFIPAILIIAGIILVVAPSILLILTELT